MTIVTESVEITQEIENQAQSGLSLFAPLKHRNFTLFWIGEGVSVLGSQFHVLAMSWLALQITGSGLALGTVYMAAAIPRAILMLVGGALADRIALRALMIGSNLVRGALVGILTALILVDAIQLWHLYVMAVLFGIADSVFYPAFESFFPRLVDEDELEAANGLVQGIFQLTNLIGPILAGVAIAAFGNEIAFGVDTFTFFFAALMLGLIRSTREVEVTEDGGEEDSEGLVTSILQGVRYVAGNAVLRTVILVIIIINFALNGPFSVGLPVLVDTQFGTPKVLGWMFGAWGGGALLGAVVAGSLSRPKYMGRIVAGLLLPVGVGMIVMGLVSALAVYLVILALMGVAIGVLNVFGMTWFQGKAAESGMMGRVMSLLMLASVGVNIFSAPVAGWAADFNLGLMFIVGGVLFLLTAVGSTFDRNFMQAE